MIRALLQNKILRCALSLFIMLSITTSLYAPSLNPPKKAEAQWAVAEVGAQLWESIVTTIESTISAVADKLTAFYEGKGWIKEYVLDPLLWALVDTILQQMSRAMVDWINSGFQGKPAFIQDLNGFLRGVADNVAGEYIWGSGLSFLCSPFQLNIKLALEIQYKAGRNLTPPQCKLSGVLSNIQGFLDGDFMSGGWDGWFAVTMHPENNQYGSLLLAQEQLSLKITNARGQEINLLSWGKGFMSRKECSQTAADGSCKQYKVVTPGSTIENQLNEHLSIGMRRLSVADEIDEIVGAFIGQLAKQAITGTMGLLGVSGASADGSTISRFDPDGSSWYTGNTSMGAGIELMQRNIQEEQRYLNVVTSLFHLLLSARTYKDTHYGNANTCHSGDLPPELENAYQVAMSEMSYAEQTLPAMMTSLDHYNTLNDPSSSQADKDRVMALYGKNSVPETISYLVQRFAQYQAGPHQGPYAGDPAGIDLTEQQLTVRPIPFTSNPNPTIADRVMEFERQVDASCSFSSSTSAG